MLANQGQQYTKRIIHHDQLEFISGMQSHCSTWKAINEIQHVNRIKNKNIIISTDTDKSFDKILYTFIIKTQQIRNTGELLQPDKGHLSIIYV